MTALHRAIPERFRALVYTAAGLVIVLAITQVIPAASTNGRGAPLAILFQGLTYGLLDGLTATGIVLVYRTTRVINFAQTAIGAGGALLCFDFVTLTGVPFPIAVVAGLIVAAGFGALFQVTFGSRFFNAPRLVLTVATIPAAGFLATAAQSLITLLPFFPDPGLRSVQQLQGTVTMQPYLPFPNFYFTFPGLPVRFHFADFFAIGLSIVALVGVGAFLRYSRAGIAVRAMAENLERASLLGISVAMLSVLVWSLAGLLSGVSVTLTGLLSTASAGEGLAPTLLLPAFTAAVVARMRSIPVAVAVSVGISWIQSALVFLQPDVATMESGGLLLVTVLGLFLHIRRQGRSEAQQSASSWAATEEIRPVPREMLALTSLKAVRWGLIAVALIAALGYPWLVQTGQQFLAAVVFLNAIVGLSLVVLTGWGGQVSLGQFGLAAIGAIAAGLLSYKLGLSFWLCVPLAALFTAGLAVLIGLPALRIPGLFLGVATLAFAAAVRDVLFNPRFFGWTIPPGGLGRPSLFLISFDDERSMYYLCLAALALSIWVVISLRRSRFGRVAIALRENEPNAESAGIPALRTKLAVFGVAGLMAGFSGALFAFQQRGISADSFNPQASLDIFIQAVVGGVSSPWGPVLGSLVMNGTNAGLGSISPDIAAAVGPTLALALLYFAPGGLMSVLAQMRDAGLRIIAQRNQLVVPSLFADMDPEALHLRLIPIGDPMAGSGLQAIRNRYRIGTSMFAVRRLATTASRDSTAIGAAATAVKAELEQPVASASNGSHPN